MKELEVRLVNVTSKTMAIENNLIHVDDKKISSDQAAYMALNMNLIEPLLDWKFITESKVGSHHIISLTEDGIYALKFLKSQP